MKLQNKYMIVNMVILTTVLVLLGFLLVNTGKTQGADVLYGDENPNTTNLNPNGTIAQPKTPENWSLVISEDGLRIKKADGSDWFWLGDTGWSLFQEMKREDAEYYFSKRASQGFTVIQAVVVMGWNRGWNDANAYGHRPFHDGDANNPNEKFWQHSDWLIKKAQKYGLFIALIPAWGSFWGNEATIEYANWITKRYRDYDNIIWVNGGDRKVGDDAELFNQIGNIFHKDEDALTTFHPSGGDASSRHFHNEKWLDFNMQQSSHGMRDIRADTQVDTDLALKPTKPTLDGEPNYEDHCVNWDSDCAKGIFNSHDVRQLAYWTVFAGATGVTYGHVHVWDFDNGGNKEDGYQDWRVEVRDSGAVQMGYMANLLMSRPHSDRAPAQHILSDESPGGLTQRAIMGYGYSLIYTSQGYNIYINLDELPWKYKSAWWFNPRDGKTTRVENFPNNGIYTCDPPGSFGQDNDWVLVIDDVSKGYTEPGR